MTVDYKSTVFLPRTDFPMRAGLPQKEPEHLARWRNIDLYREIRRVSAGRERFVLHDGPPYANGHLHIGHAVNKILKDLVVRSHQMLGEDAPYVPGWDCHGLPIEWKVEENYRAAGKNKDDVPILEFRAECRRYAEHWVNVQREDFRRMGIEGDWDDPYLTMTNDAEARIAKEIHRFLLNGGLYKGVKPVMWSVVEKTALAEAEIEYYDKTSTTIWVRFPVVRASRPALEGASVLIWTTTPWTIPGNRAVAYGPEIEYAVVEVTAAAEGASARPGERVVAAAALLEGVLKAGKVTEHRVLATLRGDELEGTVCAHPWRGRGYEFDVPMLPGGHVTTEAGTGFVHTAPGHGEEDFLVGREFGLEVPQTVGDDGTFYAHVPLVGGVHVFKADDPVCAHLTESGALFARGKLTHSYPHSWRSKKPLIFRTTPQWFISMETNDLRQRALAEIDATRWIPAQGRNRIHAMIEQRPDWCISRQRAWGVPIAIFVSKETGEPLRDPAVCDRVFEIFRREGSDAWFARDPQDFLGDAYRAEDYEQVRDVVDVWFESGSTHAFVLEQRPDLARGKGKKPASLYLEGSDQHRGWFHSSLLESVGTRGQAPYDAVLTHGFVLDEQGRKMSKSLGNVVTPQEVIANSGADILRLWVAASDYSEDIRIGPEVLRHVTEMYRRLRNTLRYLLGALDGWSEHERVPVAEMPELERWVLHRAALVDAELRASIAEYDFSRMLRTVHDFCAVDLSAFYFDIRKDSLYCDAPHWTRRRATRTVMYDLLMHLTAWLAPIVPFTAEEAWRHRPGATGADNDSVHLRTFPEVPPGWSDKELAAKWDRLREVRRVVTGALEVERAQKRIGSSLQAAPVVHVADEHRSALEGVDLAEIFITSGIEIRGGDAPAEAFRLPDVAGVAVVPALADGEKCDRCWKVLPDVDTHTEHPGVCGRCADAVGALGAAAE